MVSAFVMSGETGSERLNRKSGCEQMKEATHTVGRSSSSSSRTVAVRRPEACGGGGGGQDEVSIVSSQS